MSKFKERGCTNVNNSIKSPWRDGRAVEGNSLENCRGGNVTKGSNPFLSAIELTQLNGQPFRFYRNTGGRRATFFTDSEEPDSNSYCTGNGSRENDKSRCISRKTSAACNE